MDPHIFIDLLTLFGLGVMVVLIFHRANMPPIIGFLITGIFAGPHGFHFINDEKMIEHLGEIGVILLLFSLGIELSISKIVKLGRFLFIGGMLQVGVTILVTTMVARLMGMWMGPAVFLGMLLSLSSTALVLRFMADRGEVDSMHGKTSLGILIFQDLVIVPMMLMTPYLSGGEGFGLGAVKELTKAVFLVVAVVVVSRYLVPWLLGLVVKTRNREAFLMTLMFLCAGTAWVTAQVGLSLALGAFIAGLVISESEFSLQAFSEVMPLREVFNSMFFVSVGMLFDPEILIRSPWLVLGCVVGVIVMKFVLTSLVTFWHGYSLRVAALTGLALAQVGEFSFILAKSGQDHGLLKSSHHSLFMSIAVGSMLATPLLRYFWPQLATMLEKIFPRHWAHGSLVLPTTPIGSELNAHTIIVGFGPNGRHLAQVFKEKHIPYVIIEMNPETVTRERKRGEPILYGDAARSEVLQKAGIERARVVVIAIPDMPAIRRTVHHIRQINPEVNLLVRSALDRDTSELKRLGAQEVVNQEFETSIMLITRGMEHYDIPAESITATVKRFREERDVEAV